MSDFSIDVLKHEEKDNNILKILSAGYEYLLAGIAHEYCDFKNIKDLSEFNSKNDLSPLTLIVYPFFVAVANGHAESLYSLFGKFYSFTFGPGSISVYKLISEKSNPRPLKYFNVNLDDDPSGKNPIGVQVKDTVNYKTFRKIQDKIEEENLGLDNYPQETFKDIKIQSDIDIINGNEERPYKPLYKAINSGIAAIKTQSQNTFFDAGLEGIQFQANYFRAFQKLFRQNRFDVIKFDEIESPNRRPFYSKELVP